MPKPFNLLQKCSEIRTDGSPCRAVAVKNLSYCRHHLPNHPDELAKVTKSGGYAFLKNNDDEACRLDLNSADDITILKATIRILSERIAQLVKEPMEGKTPALLLKTIEQLRKIIETLANNDRYWEAIAQQKAGETLECLGGIIRKHMKPDEWQEFLKEAEPELKRKQERQSDGM